MDVASEAVGVCPDQFHGLFAVSLVDPHGAVGTESVRMKEEHDVPDDLLLGPCLLDPLPALPSYPLDLLQAP